MQGTDRSQFAWSYIIEDYRYKSDARVKLDSFFYSRNIYQAFVSFRGFSPRDFVWH